MQLLKEKTDKVNFVCQVYDPDQSSTSQLFRSLLEEMARNRHSITVICGYPKAVEQPTPEYDLLTDVLEPTNEPYALAKIAGIKLCESYSRQHGTDFRSVMPTNLYGINDNFHLENSHVMSALMRRFHDAKVNNDSEVVVWGTGNAMRELLYVDNMAKAS